MSTSTTNHLTSVAAAVAAGVFLFCLLSPAWRRPVKKIQPF